MIVDTSAVVAIARLEPSAGQLVEALRDARAQISAATVLECALVLRPQMGSELENLLRAAEMKIVQFDADQLAVARAAMARFGRGSGSAANLNFGDCFSYALAKLTGEPLLFIGDNFAHTDIVPALPVRAIG